MEPNSWAPAKGLVACGWALAAAAAAWFALTDAATDRLFVGVLVLALVAAAAHGSFVRPRLAADSTGLTVRTLTGSKHFDWPQVTVRVREHRRLGRTNAGLELDADPQLIVLGRLELGADPYEVAFRLHDLQP
ncbi:PH domain-containing protein [Saccharopolyspora griseoalba]|uniref:PH domain-containing protein n=1 Tax=Saccharopolyspora griseoalba TaxID=1431848 RepID=A0ABW2LLU9_9PSEU